jgi:hypothetical protein
MFAQQTVYKGPKERDKERVFGSLAGQAPWKSGKAGFVCGAVLGLPIAVAAAAQDPRTTAQMFGSLSLAGAAVTLLHLARWSVYGLVFGYFYPRLRGKSAYRKAGWFAVVMVPLEMFAAWPTLLPHTRALGLLLAGAQTAAFAMLLAVVWEIRTARLADMGWNSVRDLRSLRAIAPPVVAVLVAVTTALVASGAPILLKPPSAQAVTPPPPR